MAELNLLQKKILADGVIKSGVAHLGTEETGSLVQTAMIIAGIGSLLQMFPIGPLGSRLPIVMGISFTFVSTFCVIGANSFGGGFGNPHFGEAKYLIVGTITLVACLVFHIRAHGFYKQLSVLFGLVAGC